MRDTNTTEYQKQTQHRLFPTQKVVKTQQNHKIPPDSLSEGAFVTISHFDIPQKPLCCYQNRASKNTHYSVVAYI